jgi:PAS domain S-box-containing protein
MTTLRGPRTRTGPPRIPDLEFRELLDSLPAAAYTCDAAGLITYFNRQAVELWGREPLLNDALDRYCGSFRLFLPDGTSVPHDRCWMALAIRDDRGYNAEEIVIERSDGSRRTVLAHANPLHDRRGQTVGAVNVLVDITDRKAAETLLRDADRAKNEFLAVLAHELRSPLAPMRNALEMMRGADGEPVRRDQARGIIERQLVHLTRIVDDLLDMARITRNELELRLEQVTLGAVLGQALETTRPLLDAAGHRLHTSLPDADLVLHADPQRLAQLFANLLANAAKYTPPRGDVWLSAVRQGSEVVVSVRDSGVGFDAPAAERIFDMFARANESERLTQDGLGIGLTLARRVVELHAGTIDARSDGRGRGAEFRVRLPLVVRPAALLASAGDERALAPGRRAGSPLRILVVDDNRDSAETLAELLSMDGHETHIARDGHAAIERTAQLRPDVVLLDIGLPGVNGYEAARRIRELPDGRAVVLLALTGWGQEEDRRRSAAAGFDDHLVKPVDLDTLGALLARVRPQGERGTSSGAV